MQIIRNGAILLSLFMAMLSLTSSIYASMFFGAAVLFFLPSVTEDMRVRLNQPVIVPLLAACVSFFIGFQLLSNSKVVQANLNEQSTPISVPESSPQEPKTQIELVAKTTAKEVVIEPLKLVGLSQSQVERLLGKPVKRGTRNNWIENSYKPGKIKYSIVYVDGKSSIIDYYFQGSSISLPFAPSSLNKIGLEMLEPLKVSESSAEFESVSGFSKVVLWRSDDSNTIGSICLTTLDYGLGC